MMMMMMNMTVTTHRFPQVSRRAAYSLLTCTRVRGVILISVGKDNEVDNAGGEVEHNMVLLSLHDSDGVAITIAGPGHAP